MNQNKEKIEHLYECFKCGELYPKEELEKVPFLYGHDEATPEPICQDCFFFLIDRGCL